MSASETDLLLPKRPLIPTRTSGGSVHRHDDQGSFSRSPEDSPSRDHAFHNRDSQERDSPEDSAPLQPDDFYELIGMKVPNAQAKTSRNLEAAHGFYSQVCQEKRVVERKYRLYDMVILFLLVMQILLSAVFIVLGALNIDQHITIAVLGAISSVIAGVLALMRGQGLPNRLRMERDGLRKVILQADELYWDVGAGREVTYENVKKIRDAYSAVLEDARRNHPDTWNSASLPLAQGLTKAATPAKRGATRGANGQAGGYV